MRGVRWWRAMAVVAVLAVGACNRGDPYENQREDDPDEAPVRMARRASVQPVRPMTAADSAQAAARIAVERDSVAAALARVRVLRWREIWGLRRDVNAKQIAVAQRLGVRAGGQAAIERLVRQGRLVPLGDSTEYWVLRKMTHSSPYVTPDARALLVEVGRRFHARLDSAGLPRFRMKVTSALRTDETQAELRKTNPNASRTVSAHEFGTTVDVSYERFAVPAGPRDTAAGAAPPVPWEMEAEMLEEVGKANGRAIQALLGRSIAELRAQGALMVMMENGQTVFHFTVARPFRTAADRPRDPARAGR
ncbi:MAG TPA: DUF5715 family protein [Longimicrobium sp.]|nr:DUF5715 family protein [Longimicrobium sp.]